MSLDSDNFDMKELEKEVFRDFVYVEAKKGNYEFVNQKIRQKPEYFSEEEKMKLIQSAKITFFPYYLKALEGEITGNKHLTDVAIFGKELKRYREFYRRKKLPGILSIIDKHKGFENPSERMNTAYVRERCLEILSKSCDNEIGANQKEIKKLQKRGSMSNKKIKPIRRETAELEKFKESADREIDKMFEMSPGEYVNSILLEV